MVHGANIILCKPADFVQDTRGKHFCMYYYSRCGGERQAKYIFLLLEQTEERDRKIPGLVLE